MGKQMQTLWRRNHLNHLNLTLHFWSWSKPVLKENSLCLRLRQDQVTLSFRISSMCNNKGLTTLNLKIKVHINSNWVIFHLLFLLSWKWGSKRVHLFSPNRCLPSPCSFLHLYLSIPFLTFFPSNLNPVAPPQKPSDTLRWHYHSHS